MKNLKPKDIFQKYVIQKYKELVGDNIFIFKVIKRWKFCKHCHDTF